MSRLTLQRRRELLARLAAEDLSAADEQKLLTEYVEGLPRPEVARCPFTGVVVERSIDTFGLDGPWWDVDSLVRPREPGPPSLWAWTGAMAVDAAAVEDTPHLVKPGPAVPFVVEHLIRHPAIRAVVSALPVGPHTGYVICYFVGPGGGPEHLARVNEWGAAQYWYEDERGWWADSVTEGEQEERYDLDRWIADGKLLWIAPGDRDLKLRSEVAGCPYLDLAGVEEHQRVQFGRVWSASTVGQASGSESTKPPE